VLVIDDEPAIRAVVRMNLELDGYEVVEAPDGAAGVRLAVEESPDLVLLDLRLPLNGMTVLGALKENATTAAIPVIAFTAATERELLLEAFDAGVIDVVGKPFDPTALSSLIARRLDQLRHLPAAELAAATRARFLASHPDDEAAEEDTAS
jgi:DNA-binding response OmpR family regulator